MRSKFFMYILLVVSVGIITGSPITGSGQSLSFKNGSVMEKMVPKGQLQTVQVVDSRGQLQWQQSNDGITWQDWIAENQSSVSVSVHSILFLRCTMQEANCAAVYSDVVKLIPTGLATITTATISDITIFSAAGGGDVISDENAPVTARGVCWSTLENPTTADSTTLNGTGTGPFISSLTNLAGSTTYYVRAYCTNVAGTAYGSEVSFTTKIALPCDGKLTDARDGRQYCYKTIGIQTWMTENLAFLPVVSEPSGGSETIPHYYVYNYHGNSIDEAKSTASFTTYGVLYNWEASKTACPRGWHLPSDESWKALGISLGTSPSEANTASWQETGSVGKKLKSTFGWLDNGNGDNSSGFTALPAGYLADSGFNTAGSIAVFWSSSAYDDQNAWHRGMSNDRPKAVLRTNSPRSGGFSVRCIQNGLATVTTAKITGITSGTSISGGDITFDGSLDITARGVCWSTLQEPTTADSLTTDGTGIGSFTSHLTGLTENTTYYVRAYATNDAGTSYGSEINFKTTPNPADTAYVLVTDGDSRTLGYDEVGLHPYSALLKLNKPFEVINTATGGLTSGDLLARDAVDQHLSGGTNIVVIWAGVNDFWKHFYSPGSVYANLVNYCNLRRSKGWKVVICTEVSMPVASDGNFDDIRTELNNSIKANWKTFADGLADLSGHPNIGPPGTWRDANYFIGIHLTEKGSICVAEIVSAAINILIE